ncbi:DUF4376 domain-containing protein [Campylobacter lanienae]|uniref:DUF4376 domain-containing protein n=1 Tax=Campylobacter lanienae TaxID=75658 RepID=UPI00242A8150|nr:DUF4376 domain-containing protein [Campylobacter lanienae]MDD5785990.1 DUF4376 domain-containing protein [Campylobacter lanienae]
MIIAKNGTQYNNLNDEIIKAHATYVNSPFAKIERSLNYKQVGEGEFSYTELIDDFTDDELRAGFFEVAKIANKDTLELYANKFFNDDLEIQRIIKLEKLKSIKDSKLSEFSYQGKVYQIDESSKTNINGKISAILLSQNTEAPIKSVNWIAKDNTITQFSTAEFLAFSQAVANHIETILFKNDTLRTAINKAKSLDDLNAISLDFGE